MNAEANLTNQMPQSCKFFKWQKNSHSNSIIIIIKLFHNCISCCILAYLYQKVVHPLNICFLNTALKILVKLIPGVNFTNNLRAVFSYESLARSFFVLEVKVTLFIGAKKKAQLRSQNVDEIDSSTVRMMPPFYQNLQHSLVQKIEELLCVCV